MNLTNLPGTFYNIFNKKYHNKEGPILKKLLSVVLALAMMLLCISALAETATTTTGTATMKGFGGDITVTVTLDGADIRSVEMTGEGETEGIGKKIIDEWPNAFIEYNGIVDT